MNDPTPRRTPSQRLASLARKGALPALSGVLYFLSWIGFGIWPLAFVCFLPLLWTLRDVTPRQALRRGAWMGFVTHLGGYTWILHLLRVYAAAPPPLAALGYLAICAAQGFLFAVFAWLLRHAWLRSRAPLALLAPLCLCAVEWLYPLLFQSYTGVSLLPAAPLIQIADLGGVLTATALQAVINGALADLLLWGAARSGDGGGGFGPRDSGLGKSERAPFPLASLSAALLLTGGALAYGFHALRVQAEKEAAATHLKVGLAQPDVGEQQLHDNPRASVQALWNETIELQVRGAELVIWPEAGFDIELLDVGRKSLGGVVADHIPVGIVAGIMRGERGTRHIWNSAVTISPEGQFGDHYDKIALLAFGEYIPLGDTFPVLYRWAQLQPLSRGESTAPLRFGSWLLATSICYEGILPGQVFRTMEDHGQGRAHLLVNLTNDSWYGAGHEQEQHLMLQAMRSIEHRRWLARATSTGVSAFVDSTGRLVQTIARDTAGVAMQSVPMLEGTTLYERLGPWPGYLSLAALAWLFAAAFWRKRARN